MTKNFQSPCELIVTFNVGSATLKIGVYRHDDRPDPFIFAVNVDSKVGQYHWQGDVPTAVKALENSGNIEKLANLDSLDNGTLHDPKTVALTFLDLLTPLYADDTFIFVHRVVHGGKRHQPCQITPEIFHELSELAHLAPLHQPPALAIIDTIAKRYHAHDFIQVAGFDTAFHASRPRLWSEYALPRAVREQGVKSYGFHGLSYRSIIRTLTDADSELAKKRLIVAHLGSGCSITSILNGKTIDSSLGFSGLDGVPMGTRCGSLDSGVLLYLLEQGWGYGQILSCLYKQSGLLGLSEISNDMRELHDIRQNATDEPQQAQASFALTYFTAHVAKTIAGLITSLQGLDGLIFTGGIGEHDAWMRQQVADYLAWTGVYIDKQKNQTGLNGETWAVISPKDSAVQVWVVATDEQYELYQAGLSV